MKAKSKEVCGGISHDAASNPGRKTETAGQQARQFKK